MTDQISTEDFSYFQQIHDSPGMKFLNKLHTRSFSLNIFQMNALELMEATKKVRDPDEGLFLMSQDNKEAGQQAHRELSRHIHNFAASSKTLVDHTRVFLEENYSKTEIIKSVQTKITSTFTNDPVSKFVHDLRNYMLHKGLPNSHMFLLLQQDPAKPELGAELTTGIRFDTKSLSEWSGWTAAAKQYLEQNEEYINIHHFTEEYLLRVNTFHSWLEELLCEHHSADIERLQELQKLYADASNKLTNLRTQQPPNLLETSSAIKLEPEEEFRFTKKDSKIINEASDTLLLKIRKITIQNNEPEKFPSERPISTTITDAEIIGTPIQYGVDINGESVLIFVKSGESSFGLSDQDFLDAEEIYDGIYSTQWAKDKISRKFIHNQLITWAQENFRNDNKTPFSEAIISKSIESARPLEVWAPIAHLEIESTLEFGSVHICPITSEKIDSIERMTTNLLLEHQERVRPLFTHMRQELQGFAAVVVTLEAEPILAKEKGYIIAQNALNLLRFFSPSAGMSWVLCPTALLGSEIVPSSKIITLSESSFSSTDSLTSKNVAYWKLSIKDIEHLNEKGLTRAAKLINPDGLSDFETSLRASLITYSKSMTLTDLADRLSQTLSALERLFLKHTLEPIVSNIADRLSFVLSQTEDDRATISQIVRHAYKLSAQSRTTLLSPKEQDNLANFVSIAYQAIITALRNIDTFETKSEFIKAIDSLKTKPNQT
ncbi:hypothetical protein ACYZUC_15040 [Pseudomonas sp. GT1P32]